VTDWVWPVHAVAFHPRYQRSFATGGGDGVVNVWDAVAKIEGKPLFQLLADRYGNGQANRTKKARR
jgi:hypothetical protein